MTISFHTILLLLLVLLVAGLVAYAVRCRFGLRRRFFYLLHDMGNYITILNGYSQLACKSKAADLPDLIKEIQVVSKKMQNAVDGSWVLSYGKKRFDQMDTINVTDFILEAYGNRHFHHALKDFKWDVKLTHKPFFVDVNVYLFQSVMDNIAFNILRHAKPKGEALFQTRIQGGKYYIKARNEKIKSAQGSAPQSLKKHRGGLTIMKTFADLMGIEMQISENKNVFEVQLVLTSAN
ncbi:HAMP domain-containing histidine kinase [Candidatus Peregrinibacteria bacterium]|nr:MAG: HAMP domain-containing histidine kinase [Candidatus Peregrinibacteria bacterium]